MHHKRHVVAGTARLAGTARHVIPRRSLGPRLLLTWTTTIIVATSPFVWFHLVSGWTSTSEGVVDAQSKFRKLVLCVFLLSFVMPAAGVAVAYLLLLRTWITTAHTGR